MARPRVFISSTFYDLKYIRASLENFIQSLGYEPVLSENGQIAYNPDIPLDESCYREAASAEIFVLIVGGRYGSVSSDEALETTPEFYDRYESITKKEFESAADRDIPTYILVERAVMGEYEIFRKNKNNESIEYSQVQSVNVFHFLDHILARRRNNPVYQFERPSEIEYWLKEQWAGLFREMIVNRSKQKEIASLSKKVEELASINISLQRYLEEVVKNVDKDNGNTLVEEERTRQSEAKHLRDFYSNNVVDILISNNNIPQKTVLKIFQDSKTAEELARETANLINFNPDDLVWMWKNSYNTREQIKLARECLGLSPLEFSSDTSTQSSTKQETNKEKDTLD